MDTTSDLPKNWKSNTIHIYIYIYIFSYTLFTQLSRCYNFALNVALLHSHICSFVLSPSSLSLPISTLYIHYKDPRGPVKEIHTQVGSPPPNHEGWLGGPWWTNLGWPGACRLRAAPALSICSLVVSACHSNWSFHHHSTIWSIWLLGFYYLGYTHVPQNNDILMHKHSTHIKTRNLKMILSYIPFSNCPNCSTHILPRKWKPYSCVISS